MPLLLKPKITPQTRDENGEVKKYFMIYCGTDNGKGVKFYRNNERNAIECANQFSAKAKYLGALANKLTPEQTVDAASAIATLADNGIDMGIAECVRAYAKMMSVNVKCTASQVLGEYLKRLEQRSPVYRNTARRTITEFMPSMDAPTSALTADVIRRKLDAIKSPKTYNSTRAYLLAFINWAQKNGKYPEQLYRLCLNIERRREIYTPPEFFMASEVEKIMRYAESRMDAGLIVPKYALGFFAGIRTAEIHRMTWGNIKFAENEIRVETPKGARGILPRIVNMSANLKAWLQEYQLTNDMPICASGEKFSEFQAVMLDKLNIEWPRNVCRHTFATMSLAMYRDYASTAADMGHSSNSDVLRKVYANITSKADATAFWNIKPTR